MVTIAVILALSALIIAILSSFKPVPLWIAVVLLAILELLEHIPLR
jgi:hypothetical protein